MSTHAGEIAFRMSGRPIPLGEMSERDLFANFERMRREMDELFGDVFERTGLGRRRSASRPPWMSPTAPIRPARS